MYKNIGYLNGLNALRFFAAYLVVIHHAETIREKYGLFDLKEYSLFNNGGLAVNFFFVLSGFLITYLLLKEQIQKGDISIKKFYTRRILRIWPLYFLLIVIGTAIVPVILDYLNSPVEIPYSFSEAILYFVFFAPFMVNIIFGHHLLEPLWSIGVEELFYIMWAPLFKFLRNNILKIILGVILLKVMILLLLIFQFPGSVFLKVANMLQFEAMAIGGLGAYFLYNCKKEIGSMAIFSKAAQIVFIVFVVLRLTGFKYLSSTSAVFDILWFTPILSNLIIDFVFIWLIVNVSLNNNSLIKGNMKFFNFLGNVSYGIYMYHMLVIFAIVLFGSKFLNDQGNITSTICFYLLLTTAVIVVSYLSKKYFEDKFLRLKSKFQGIEK